LYLGHSVSSKLNPEKKNLKEIYFWWADENVKGGGPTSPTSPWKVEIKLSLRLIKHYAMKTYGGVDV
jgi:hypothetical protein